MRGGRSLIDTGALIKRIGWLEPVRCVHGRFADGMPVRTGPQVRLTGQDRLVRPRPSRIPAQARQQNFPKRASSALETSFLRACSASFIASQANAAARHRRPWTRTPGFAGGPAAAPGGERTGEERDAPGEESENGTREEKGPVLWRRKMCVCVAEAGRPAGRESPRVARTCVASIFPAPRPPSSPSPPQPLSSQPPAAPRQSLTSPEKAADGVSKRGV